MTKTITHEDAIAAIRAANLDSLMGNTWACDDHEECDTAWMLTTVADLDVAIALLDMGYAPDGVTPWPDAAMSLLHRRQEWAAK